MKSAVKGDRRNNPRSISSTPRVLQVKRSGNGLKGTNFKVSFSKTK